MKLFVWRGPNVLKNYTAGLVVIAAHDANAAWCILHKTNIHAWYRLQYDVRTVYDEGDVVWLSDDDFPGQWEAIQPEVFDLNTLPALIMNGGE